MLSKSEKARYSRQISLASIGEKGQMRLKRANIAVVGIGGIGNPVSTYLAQAGVGKIRLIDRDVIEESNLQRQFLFSEADIGREKASVAAEKIAALNQNVAVEAVANELNTATIEQNLGGFDVVVDATDNFEAKLLLNEWCVKNKVPLIYSAALENKVAVMTVLSRACLRCLMPTKMKETRCADVGVLNTAMGTAGMFAATEVINTLLGKPALDSRLLQIDMLTSDFSISEISKNAECQVCVKQKFELLAKAEEEVFIFKPCATSAAFESLPTKQTKLDLVKAALTLKNAGHEVLLQTRHILVVKSRHSLSVFPNGRIMIKDVADRNEAKSEIEKVYRLLGML